MCCHNTSNQRLLPCSTREFKARQPGLTPPPRIEPGFRSSRYPLSVRVPLSFDCRPGWTENLAGLRRTGLTKENVRLGRALSSRRQLVCVPVVVWLKRPILVQAQILGLLVGELREMCVECWEMQAGHIFVWGGRRKSTLAHFSWVSFIIYMRGHNQDAAGLEFICLPSSSPRLPAEAAAYIFLSVFLHRARQASGGEWWHTDSLHARVHRRTGLILAGGESTETTAS